jgi:hypothetical protein
MGARFCGLLSTSWNDVWRCKQETNANKHGALNSNKISEIDGQTKQIRGEESLDSGGLSWKANLQYLVLFVLVRKRRRRAELLGATCANTRKRKIVNVISE